MSQAPHSVAQQLPVDSKIAFRKTGKGDIAAIAVFGGILPAGSDGDAGGGFRGIVIDARTDARKGDGAALLCLREVQGAGVTVVKQYRLIPSSTPPNRTDSVYDVFRGETIPGGDFRRTRGASAKGPAFLQKLFAGSVVISARTAENVAVSGDGADFSSDGFIGCSLPER